MLKSVKKRHLWLYIIAVVASLGGLLSGFDTGVISGALIFINETWSMTPLEQGWVVSSAIVGAVIGAALNGVLSDIYGRKKIIIATGIIFALGSVFCAYAVSVHWLMASRMIIGLAVGMVNFIIPLYLSEISPQKYAECWFLFFSLQLPPEFYSPTSSTAFLPMPNTTGVGCWEPAWFPPSYSWSALLSWEIRRVG